MTPGVVKVLIQLAVWIVSLVGIGVWQRYDGALAERSAWEGRESSEIHAANEKIIALENSARKAEQDKATALATVSTDYERKLTDANKQRAADGAAVRGGGLRLRDPNPPGLRAGGRLAPGASAGACRCDGAPSGQLSAEASEFLLDLASDADDTARQLTACQRVVMEDRK